MSEYIMGLGISVKICKIYDELIGLTLADNEYSETFDEYVDTLRKLIEDETVAYKKLDEPSTIAYFDKISENNETEFDNVKSRYYSKLCERINVFDNGKGVSSFPFSLNTAIIGKILLEALQKVEKKILDSISIQEDKNTIDVLYSFHKTYKYTVISMNDFLERLAILYYFDLDSIPEVSFDKIKCNFKCNDNFSEYLNNRLLDLAKEIINILIIDCQDVNVNDIYSSLLAMSQLEVIISYLNKEKLEELVTYCKLNNIYSCNKGSYVKNLINGKKKK